MNTPYFLNLISGNIFGLSSVDPFPEKFYIGLSGSEPNEYGICPGEPFAAGSGYERVQLKGLYNLSNGVITNASEITFKEASASWGDMKYYIVYDAANGGNLLFWDKLSKNVTVDTNHVVTFKPGSMIIRVVNPEQV